MACDHDLQVLRQVIHRDASPGTKWLASRVKLRRWSGSGAAHRMVTLKPLPRGPVLCLFGSRLVRMDSGPLMAHVHLRRLDHSKKHRVRCHWQVHDRTALGLHLHQDGDVHDYAASVALTDLRMQLDALTQWMV